MTQIIIRQQAKLRVSDIRNGRLMRSVNLGTLTNPGYTICTNGIVYVYFSANTQPQTYRLRRYKYHDRKLNNMGQETTLLRYDGFFDGELWWFLGGTNVNAYDGYNPNTANLQKNFAHGATTPRGLFDMGQYYGVLSAS